MALRNPLFLLLSLLAASPVTAGSPYPLAAYITEALDSNQALQQSRLDLERSLMVLRQARALFLPSVDLQARYSRAGGGRRIELPLGDLLNPAYRTLNELVAAQGGNPSFPTLDNESIDLLRQREQETKVRLVQPLYAPRLRHSYRLQNALTRAEGAALEALRGEIIRQVKTAYFSLLQAEGGVAIYTATDSLARENWRVSQRLWAADRVTEDAVLRARAELLDIEQQRDESVSKRDLARAFFNFLLNRPLETPVEIATAPADTALFAWLTRFPALRTPDSPGVLSELQELAVEQRREVAQLEAAVEAAQSGEQLAGSAFRPSLALVLDAGIQGRDYSLGDDSSFYMGSLVLSWNLFSGGTNQARRQQAALETQKRRVETEQLADRIRLQVQEAHDGVRVARRSLRTADERVRAARQGYRIAARRYQEGMANPVVLLDARTALTRAELNLNITRYQVLVRLAELEYAAGLAALAL